MNIRDIQSGPGRAEQTRTEALGSTNKVAPGSQAPQEEAVSAQSVKDRVEISAAARAAATENIQTQELGFARKALLGIPPLSQDRASDILRRIQEGFYSQPEVVKQVASEVTTEFIGVATEEQQR